MSVSMQIETELLRAVLCALEKTDVRRLRRGSGRWIPVASVDGGPEWRLSFPMYSFNMHQIARPWRDGKFIEYRYLPIGSDQDAIDLDCAASTLREMLCSLVSPDPEPEAA